MLLAALTAAALGQDAAQVFDATGPIAVDGVLDEADWSRAIPVTEFLRYTPLEGGPPSGRTEVRFLQDEHALYVGIRVAETDYRVRGRLSAREKINQDDQVGIYLDTFGDERTGYIFYTNAVGIQQDVRHNNGKWNIRWNTAYRTKGRMTEHGYELEIAMPWRSLKYQRADEQTWGLMITRKTPHDGSKYSWPQRERGFPRVFSQAGALEGVRPGGRSSGIELIPALTVQQGWPREDADDPMRGLDAPLEVLTPSLDARVGLTADIGLTATLNPDFSQVESDISDVRLNPQFAFKFRETRAFFLDGNEFFVDRQKTLYTRSIAEPLYGMKVSGREGPWALGVLHALDRSPLPTFNENRTPGFGEAELADRQALNTMARIRLDTMETGTVGLTFVDKRILDDTERDRPGGVHQAIGLDADLPLGGRWFVGASSLQTLTGPAGDVPMWGQANEVYVERSTGMGTGIEAFVGDRSPGLRQETGFLTQSGQTYASLELDHTLTPDRLVQTWTPEIVVDLVTERNREYNHSAGIGQKLVVAGVHELEMVGGLTWRAEGPASASPVDNDPELDKTMLRGWYAEAEYEGRYGPFLEVEPTARVAEVIDFVYLVPAMATELQLEGSLLPMSGIRLDATTRWNWQAPEGEALQASRLLRGRLTWQFSQPFGLRIIEEHIQGTEYETPSLASSFLLTWLEVPGTALWLGYTESGVLGPYAVEERYVFAKASVLLRP